MGDITWQMRLEVTQESGSGPDTRVATVASKKERCRKIRSPGERSKGEGLIWAGMRESTGIVLLGGGG
jgi:hypothetical protein